MSRQTNTTLERIITILEQNGGEVQGTELLTLLASKSKKCKSFILRAAKRLQVSGQITISRSCGGRGHKTVYKRNPNQPGMARKVTR